MTKGKVPANEPLASAIRGTRGLAAGPGSPGGPGMRVPFGLCLTWHSLQLSIESATPCFVGTHRRSVAIPSGGVHCCQGRRSGASGKPSRLLAAAISLASKVRICRTSNSSKTLSCFDPIGLNLQFLGVDQRFGADVLQHVPVSFRLS